MAFLISQSLSTVVVLMRWIPSLPRLAIMVWVAWLVLVGLMFGMQARQVWHPHFLPITAVLAVLVVSGFFLIVGASWRWCEGLDGGRRWLAFFWVRLRSGSWQPTGHMALKRRTRRTYVSIFPSKCWCPSGGR